MPPDDRERIEHMLEAVREAREFTDGRTRDDLANDRMFELALTRLVEILGEAAKHVSQPIRDLAPDVPWRDICGARDRLAHGYFSVDHTILWAILSVDLPPLEERLVSILRTLDRHRPGS